MRPTTRAGWRCPAVTPTGTALPGEYPRDSNRTLSEQDFGAMIAIACSSERQNFRVALVDYLGTQSTDSDASMTTANNAIALAQKDIVTAFSRRKAAAK